MRLVNRDVFLSMEPGTIYSYCLYKEDEDFDFNGINVKHETIGNNDWCYTNPQEIRLFYGEDFYNKLKEMLVKGISCPMGNGGQRDGLFDANAVFLIFEKEDLLLLRKWIDEAIEIAK